MEKDDQIKGRIKDAGGVLTENERLKRKETLTRWRDACGPRDNDFQDRPIVDSNRSRVGVNRNQFKDMGFHSSVI